MYKYHNISIFEISTCKIAFGLSQCKNIYCINGIFSEKLEIRSPEFIELLNCTPRPPDLKIPSPGVDYCCTSCLTLNNIIISKSKTVTTY